MARMLGGPLHLRTARRLGTATAVLAVSATLIVPLLAAPVVRTESLASTAGTAALPEANLTATAHDLGALGGRYSEATAVDGSIVVGWLRTASGEFHAFAYDLRGAEPEMLDLGTLGGDFSKAVDVSGTVVVGTSSTPSGDRHAFAYDLGAAEPAMLDLGTLGGTSSEAAAVDGTTVVGASATTSGGRHAFAYDLAATEPGMDDLGTLGEGGSTAMAVDGSVVAGFSYVATGLLGDPYDVRAFAYDLAAPEPSMRDLGTLGGSNSFATAVAGTVVVGWSNTARNPRHAFAYDLAATEPAMEDLGTVGRDSTSVAADVDGSRVVGTSSSTRARNLSRAFVHALAAAEPEMREFDTLRGAQTRATAIDGAVVTGRWTLPRQGDHALAHDLDAHSPRTLGLGTWRGSEAVDVDGDVVVGSAAYGSTVHATAWVLRETTRPMLAFRRLDRRVKEGTGRVTVRVTRYGRTDRAVTVRYRTRSDDAKAGRDFVATSGKLRFARGVTARSFTVKVRNDRKREGQEALLLTLLRPSSGALLGTPRWSQLRIRTNDR